jgi:tRNA G10  N-methylase Trm11
MSTALSTAPREDNKLRIEDRAAHDWYRFVLSFPAHLVRDYVSRFEVDSTGLVLDPFCGTGTTLVECKKLGIRSVGIESNPMASFASQVKVSSFLFRQDILSWTEAV